jgi:hypothetical protein
MRPVPLCVLLGLPLILGGAFAAPPHGGREPTKDREKQAAGVTGDLTCADTSTVRITLVNETVELETKYGKLTIPAADVQRIEFAFRLPGDVARKITAAVKRLGDSSFEEREAAGKVLREIGLRAYPALEEAARSDDAEVKRLASMLLEEVRAKVSADDLTFPKKDRIQTAEFTVTGRITSPVLRAKTAYFGEADLKLADLRVFQASGIADQNRLTVDAALFGSAADQWKETSLSLERGAPLKVVASGQVDLWPQEPGQYVTTPKGGYGNVRASAFPPGSLVGRVGENGTPFLIGEKYEGKASASGKLYLHIIPSPWGNASTGTYEVKVAVGER